MVEGTVLESEDNHVLNILDRAGGCLSAERIEEAEAASEQYCF
jgi:hypothetical protein